MKALLVVGSWLSSTHFSPKPNSSTSQLAKPNARITKSTRAYISIIEAQSTVPNMHSKKLNHKKQNSGGAAQLNDFINRAAKAKIITGEPAPSSQDSAWEVLDEEVVKKNAQDAEDKIEWVIVGKTEAEKQRRLETAKKRR
jgi:hypothetical protein